MISRKYFLFAVASLLGSADFAVASTRQCTERTFLVSKRLHDDTRRIAFFRSEQQPEQTSSQNQPPLSPLTGWISDFSKAVKEDFAAVSENANTEILHECVVNYRKGLVGNF
ncbi:hypothetical protein IV203_003798 [Nitzschia inconspicua]|uniref:Uncharacterized protein n=1 Tax=Nitzschia inconspicua TaxID=303405 RepID=A0A9K3L307_9STRA|nr:hypothetical protein IV203_003798 [Nitzschia inconspicua]